MIVGITALFTYFITSSDSASQVCDMISSNGELEPPYWQRIFWAVTEGGLALALTSTGKEKAVGGDYHVTSSATLNAIKAASIVAGFPLCWIMLILIVATWKSLNVELKIINGEPLPHKKDFKIPCVDAFTQILGKCLCGMGAIWLTENKDPMEWVRACVSCFCPCLAMMRIVQQTTTSMAGKAAWAFSIMVPYICLIVWFALCPKYIEWFDTKAMELDGKSYYNEDDCKD